MHAAGTETTAAAATQLVSGLVAAGYVTRERTEQDKRSVLVALTDTGRQRHRERQSGLNQALHDALAEHDTATLDAATDVLRHLASSYDDL
jgi:DNA-binding MarR family transcriptional regulator